MKSLKFSIEELQELESLQIRGGGDDVSETGTQNGCSNNAKGCGVGVSQIDCSNNVTGCGTSSEGSGDGPVPIVNHCPTLPIG